PPLRGVVSIEYRTADGSIETLSFDDVTIETTGADHGRIVLKYGKRWPSATLDSGYAVTVRYRAGYSVPFTVTEETNMRTAPDLGFQRRARVRVWNTRGSPPAPLKPNTHYYALDVSGDTLKQAETPGSEAIDITTPGYGTHFLGLFPESVRTAMGLI